MHSPFPVYSLALKVLPENVRRRRYRGFKAFLGAANTGGFLRILCYGIRHSNRAEAQFLF